MQLHSFARESERFVREYDYDDGTVFVADIGGAATIDVVGTTLMVVPAAGEQFELELPSSDATAFMNNGVLTVEVSE